MKQTEYIKLSNILLSSVKMLIFQYYQQFLYCLRFRHRYDFFTIFYDLKKKLLINGGRDISAPPTRRWTTRRRTSRRRFQFYFYFSIYEEKTMKQAIS